MDRDAALAEFESARVEREAAFAQVPDGALAYLKPGDDYPLGGLPVHVNWALTHYRLDIAAIIAGAFKPLGPQDSAGEGDAAGQKAKEGLAHGERAKALSDMGRLHAAVTAAMTKLSAADWSRKCEGVYGEGQDPYPTSPEDIVEWLRDHYREHVTQSADLIDAWEARG